MTSMSSTSLSICAFAISASIYVGYRNIKRELQRLQTEVVNCNRRDFSRRLEGSDASCNMAMKKIDLLLEMHSVISHEKMEGEKHCFFYVSY